MSRTTEDVRTEDAALRRIAREDRTPADYYAGKAADRATLREALALAQANGDREAIARLTEALERASYLGD